MQRRKISLKASNGFTIVELLIVIVVIAILAAITITTYNGVQQRANNTARITDVRNWQKIFSLYAALNGGYPTAQIGTKYCLGTGFPRGTNNEPRCHNYYDNRTFDEHGKQVMYYPPGHPSRQGDTDGINVLESYNVDLMNMLKTVEPTLPTGPKEPIGAMVGPWLYYHESQTNPKIYQTFHKSDSSDPWCPDGMTLGYRGTRGNVCFITLQ